MATTGLSGLVVFPAAGVRPGVLQRLASPTDHEPIAAVVALVDVAGVDHLLQHQPRRSTNPGPQVPGRPEPKVPVTPTRLACSLAQRRLISSAADMPARGRLLGDGASRLPK